MINDLNFEGGVKLLPHAVKVAQNIHALKKRLKENQIPVIYVNDNYGKWQSDFQHLVDYCLQSDVLGNQLATIIRPDHDDYFVLKPQFSGFFQTPLELLLTHLQVNTLILTGVAANMCVQFTANDAYMRNYKLLIPKDCVASETTAINEQALSTMEQVTKADIRASTELYLTHEKKR